MKLSEAMAIINNNPQRGYMVNFERVEGNLLVGDHFPDKHSGEKLIKTSDKAWKLAIAFAAKTYGECVNVRIVDEHFSPIAGFRTIKNRD